jgi:GT2 family glycosyltransferase
MDKVLVIIVAKDHPSVDCMESVLNQDCENFTILLHIRKPEEIHYNPQVNKSKNVALNRNETKKLALASDADYFLLVDSDMVIPKNTISSLIRQMPERKSDMPCILDGKEVPAQIIPRRHIVGGWCQVMDKSNRWVAGKWVGDNMLFQYQDPQPHLIEVDFLSLACVMLSRKALTELDFEDGLDKECYSTLLKKKMNLGTCVAFCNKAADKGYRMFVDGSVVCRHIKSAPEKLVMPKPISICTVVWNGLDFTQKFIESLKSNMKFPYELVVVDNGSEPEVSEYLKKQTGKYFRFPKNVGFSKAFNKAVSMASCEYILLTNNDTIYPQFNWGRVLEEEFEKSKRCGLLFPCVNNILLETNRRNAVGTETIKLQKNKNTCSGVSIFTKRSIFDKLGGFDERFFASGEDADLQFKAWKRGYEVYVTEKVFVEHVGKATAKSLPDWKTNWEEGLKVFRKKWGRSHAVLLR